MGQYRRYAPVALAIVLGIILQGALILADMKDSPSKAVVEFSKAYFQIDPSMAKRLCKDRRSAGDIDIVNIFIHLAAQAARDRGFSLNYMKNNLYDIETATIRQDGATAEVRITGKRYRSLNPVYAIVTKLFGFSTPYEVDEIISVVKENGTWKVCGRLFSLPEKV